MILIWYHFVMMKFINRDTDYAIKALCFLAQAKEKEKIISVSELVQKLKIPRPFLRKIFQKLNQGKILRSYKGNGGGFSLAMPAKSILLVDLIKIFQGEFQLNSCLFKKGICPDVRVCLLKHKLEEIERHVVRELKSITIESLLN